MKSNLSSEHSITTLNKLVKQLTFILRGEISTATILADFIASSSDTMAAEYGHTLCRCIKNITAVLEEFDINYHGLVSSEDFQENAFHSDKSQISTGKHERFKGSFNDTNSSATILVVEDNIVNQTLICKLLTRMGYKVSAVSSGEEALQITAKHNFAMILMDITLPGIDGHETTRQLKKLDQSKNIPVVALSARNENNDISEAFKAGMDDYLTKPVNLKALTAITEKLTKS